MEPFGPISKLRSRRNRHPAAKFSAWTSSTLPRSWVSVAWRPLC